MEKITVITPAYNASEFIGECIDSVQASVTLGEFAVEHLVIDDSSTDGTAKILSETKRPNLRTIMLEKNTGAANARNVALENCNSKYVYFLDADDILFANSLRYLHMTKSVWMYGDFIRGDKNGRYLLGQDYYGWKFKSTGDVLAAMYSGLHFFQQNSLFERQAIEKVGMFDESLVMADDFDLCTRILLSGVRPVYLPGPLYLHRLHEHNLSRTHMANPEFHKIDVRKLFNKYELEIKKVLTGKQLKRVVEYVRNTGV